MTAGSAVAGRDNTLPISGKPETGRGSLKNCIGPGRIRATTYPSAIFLIDDCLSLDAEGHPADVPAARVGYSSSSRDPTNAILGGRAKLVSCGSSANGSTF
jgi:hypothetical protein